MAKDAKPSAKTETPAPAREALRARAKRYGSAAYRWLRGTRVGRMVAVAAIVVALIGAGFGLTLVFRPAARPAYMRQLAQAFARLDAGDMREARRLAAGLINDSRGSYQDRGGAYYIIGSITLREADEQSSFHKRQLLDLVAARYLDEARSRGIPHTREREGLLMLGRALHDAGRYARSIPILQEALNVFPEAAAQIHPLLADSYLHLKPPRLAEALQHQRQFLASAELSAQDRQAAQLLEGNILLAQRDFAGAIAAASQVDERSRVHLEAVVLKSRARLGQLQQAAASQQPAAEAAEVVEELRRLLADDGLPTPIAAQAQLMIGLAMSQQGDLPGAKEQFDRTRRTYFGHPEGLTAMVLLADLVVRSSPAEAVALYKRALLQAGNADTYDNTWLPAEQLQKHAEAAIDGLAETEHFAEALELAESLAPPFARMIALSRQEEIHQAWARRLQDQARGEKLPQSGLTEAEARHHWREAGAACRELADLRIATRYYLDDLARAADLFRRGQGYEQAVAVYRDLLREDPRRGHPEALAGIGESLLALGQIDAALRHLNDCRDAYPTHPVTYRARLLGALALQNQGKSAEAKELLVDNLYRFSLAPQSTDWRDSLFALGALLYREAMDLESRSRLAGVDRTDELLRQAGLALLEQSHSTFDEAIRTLSEAVQRYPTAPQAVEARYRIAEAYRHSAKWPRKRWNSVTIETSRASLARQMQEHLNAAVSEYNSLITRLSEEPDATRGPTEMTIMRNCYFGRADALFDLARYDEAVAAYSAATNRYQHDPESLEAYVQIASCYRRLNRLGEARGTLDQAKAVLQRIRADADFTSTTRLARQDWPSLLDWLRTL